jgi:hypothetical protein
MKRTLIVSIAAAVGLAVVAPAATASAASTPTLADILLSDSSSDNASGFDRRAWDYDIVTQAVLLFPDLVDAASDPEAVLTAFLPNDLAFRVLVYELTGRWIWSESGVFDAVASLGLETVEAVLTYHLIGGAAISYQDALGADGAVLTTLQGGTIEVDVRGRWWKRVRLIDQDSNDYDPYVVQANIGGQAANGYAHGISAVLRPVDLP